MRLLKKVPMAVLAALLACALIACGGQKPAETGVSPAGGAAPGRRNICGR